MITMIVGFIKCQFLSTRVMIRMASSSLEDVELGFAEKLKDLSRLTSPYFPSKIGGKPAWLDPRLPVPEDLVCRKCNKPRVFLLQVYAPVDDLIHCYHRTLYIFCCREPSCHSRNYTEPFLVLRCNLPQTNPFYDNNESPGLVYGDVAQSKDVPDTANRDANSSESIATVTVNSDMQDDSTSSTNRIRSTGDTVINSVADININNEHLVQEQQNMSESLLLPSSLCAVCGCSGPKWCAKCHSMYYCSREHQVIHWKAGHKKYCGDDKQPTDTDVVASGILFEEFEIVTEPEPPIKVTPEKSEEECMKDYHKFLQQQSGNAYSTKMDKMCLDEAEKDMKKDKQFMTFKKRIAIEPDQVIRYQRGGAPLWISSEHLPNQIPDCERCGCKRVFEFQVMPQLLYYLKLDATDCPSIDWGTLTVYSCEKSCAAGPTGTTYQPEFLWKQDPSMY